MINMINKEEGFTLIEVLIAVSILTVGLLAVGAMQVSAIRGNAFSDNATKSMALAEEKMETLLQLAYDDSELDDGSHGPNEINEAGQVETGGFYTRSWEVTDHSAPDYKEIKITVKWRNDQHQLELDSIKRR